MEITLFNKKITTRDKYCDFFDSKGSPITTPYVNVYVTLKGCNANCLFCEYKNSGKTFNQSKYENILNELKYQNIELRKLAFTGGEPTLNYNNFKDLFEFTRGTLPKQYITMNTNGVNLSKLYEDKILDKLNDLSLSRHHFNEVENNKILGFDSISTKELTSIQSSLMNKQLIQFSCNLIKGEIDNHEKAIEFLEYTNKVGINKVGFVALMPINKYCIDNFVDIDVMNFQDNYHNSKRFTNPGCCQCNNYLYPPENFNGKFINVYLKNTYNPSPLLTNTLQFDGENLRYGFGGEIIY